MTQQKIGNIGEYNLKVKTNKIKNIVFLII